jgi:hypothetical protein
MHESLIKLLQSEDRIVRDSRRIVLDTVIGDVQMGQQPSGERFFLELLYLNAENFQLFVDAFAQASPDSLYLLLLDNSVAHTAQRIRWPEHVRYVGLPPYCPELNPIQRVWRDLKDYLAWQQFANLDVQQTYVGD